MLLGHAKADVTQVYAEADIKKAGRTSRCRSAKILDVRLGRTRKPTAYRPPHVLFLVGVTKGT